MSDSLDAFAQELSASILPSGYALRAYFPHLKRAVVSVTTVPDPVSETFEPIPNVIETRANDGQKTSLWIVSGELVDGMFVRSHEVAQRISAEFLDVGPVYQQYGFGSDMGAFVAFVAPDDILAKASTSWTAVYPGSIPGPFGPIPYNTVVTTFVTTSQVAGPNDYQAIDPRAHPGALYLVNVRNGASYLVGDGLSEAHGVIEFSDVLRYIEDVDRGQMTWTKIVTATPNSLSEQNFFNPNVSFIESEYLVPTEIFTSSPDLVDFNNLDDDQWRIIHEYEPNIYRALEGSDEVRLPKTSVAPSIDWDFEIFFEAGPGNDTVFGGDDADRIRGGEGFDILTGGEGNDILDGGESPDVLVGNSGADTFLGGDGTDVVSYADGTAFRLSLADAYSTGDATGDIIDDSVEIIVASRGNDSIFIDNFNWTVFGNGGNDFIEGGSGDDFISGDNEIFFRDFEQFLKFAVLGRVEGREGFGSDTLIGGLGADTLVGGEGDDKLIAGTPKLGISPDNAANLLIGGIGQDTLDGWTLQGQLADTLDGGEGTDIYWVDGQDRIVNFELNETAYFATAGPIGSYVVYSPRFGETTIAFFDEGGIKGARLGTLTFENRIIPEQITVRAPLQLPSLAVAEIVNQYSSDDFNAAAIAAIWANTRVEQFKLVAWKLVEELLGKAAGFAFAKQFGNVIADRMFDITSDNAMREAFAGFVETITSETFSTVVTNIAKEDAQVLSASDIAQILATATAGVYGKALKGVVSWGPTVANLIWLEVKAGFEQKAIELFGLPDSTGIYRLKSGTNEFVLDGRVVRDYLSGASVFADANGNGTLDSGEQSTVTDGSGQFKLVNPIGPLIVTGGIDIATRLPFEGTLRATPGSPIVSPITTLAVALEDAGLSNGGDQIGQLLGLAPAFDLRSSDVVAGTLSDSADAVKALIFTHALAVTKQAATAAFQLNQPASAIDATFYNVFAKLIAAGTPTDLLSQSSIKTLLTELAIELGQPVSTSFIDEVAAVVADVTKRINDLGGTQSDDIVGAAAAIARTFSTEVAPAIALALGNADNFEPSSVTGAALSAAVAAARAVLTSGTNGSDFILGTDASENLSALGGNDTVWAGLGNDTIDGGEGTDLAGYGIARAQASVQRGPDGSIVIQAATFGTDKLINVERIQLNDGSFILDLAGADPALVYRLYQAAFARTPDEGGLRYWASAADQFNLSQLQLATEFRTSAEFIAKYGANVSNRDYTYNMYKNVLGREPDQGGIDYWTNVVDIGWVSRDQLLIEFAQSPENVGLTAPNTTAGYWVV